MFRIDTPASKVENFRFRPSTYYTNVTEISVINKTVLSLVTYANPLILVFADVTPGGCVRRCGYARRVYIQKNVHPSMSCEKFVSYSRRRMLVLSLYNRFRSGGQQFTGRCSTHSHRSSLARLSSPRLCDGHQKMYPEGVIRMKVMKMNVMYGWPHVHKHDCLILGAE
jgi:hypothetical protein